MLLGKVKLESKSAYCSLLLITSVLFYTINALTPLYSDDWHYGFIWGTSVHISSLTDVLFSQYNHYFGVNGRFIPHLLLQTFDGLLGKNAFNIANTFVFVLMLHMLNLNFVKDKNMYFKSTAVSAFSILLLSCGFRNAFLWMSGAFNYLWGFTLLLLFNYQFNKTTTNKFLFPLLFLFGVLSGWTNEAYVAGYCCSMLFYLYKKRKSIRTSQIILLLGLLTGACLLCLSPGSIHRSGISDSTFDITPLLRNLSSSLIHMSNVRLFLIAFVLLFLKKESRTHWAIAMLSSFLFVLITGHTSSHSRFGAEMFATIIILSVVDFNKIKNWIAISLSGITIVVLTSAIPFCIDNYRIFKNMEKNVSVTKDGIIPMTTTKTPMALERFVLHYKFKDDSDFDNTKIFNKNIAQYYGTQPLAFIDSKLLNDIYSGKEFKLFECPSPYLYYVREWDRNDSIHSIKFLLSPSKLNKCPIFNRMERFTLNEIPVNHYSLVNINNRTYLIVAKNETVDDRVIGINAE